MTMKVHIGTDHAGFEMKEQLKPFIKSLGYEVIDHGAFFESPGDDYPEFIKPVAEAVAADQTSKGVILGGSGEGEQMTANRYPGVRAAEFYGGDLEIVRVARQHNDANILSLGARFLGDDKAMNAVEIFLETPFSGEARHERRIQEIDN